MRTSDSSSVSQGPVRVAAVRSVAAFGSHWEQGKRRPEGPTRAYLLVIERAPKAVQTALHAA
jgi:hypothetical protein